MRRLVATALLIAISSCSFLPSQKQESPAVERNVLTGLPGDNGKVLAVKFDDTTYSHPQQGYP